MGGCASHAAMFDPGGSPTIRGSDTLGYPDMKPSTLDINQHSHNHSRNHSLSFTHSRSGSQSPKPTMGYNPSHNAASNADPVSVSGSISNQAARTRDRGAGSLSQSKTSSRTSVTTAEQTSKSKCSKITKSKKSSKLQMYHDADEHGECAPRETPVAKGYGTEYFADNNIPSMLNGDVYFDQHYQEQQRRLSGHLRHDSQNSATANKNPFSASAAGDLAGESYFDPDLDTYLNRRPGDVDDSQAGNPTQGFRSNQSTPTLTRSRGLLDKDSTTDESLAVTDHPGLRRGDASGLRTSTSLEANLRMRLPRHEERDYYDDRYSQHSGTLFMNHPHSRDLRSHQHTSYETNPDAYALSETHVYADMEIVRSSVVGALPSAHAIEAHRLKGGGRAPSLHSTSSSSRSLFRRVAEEAERCPPATRAASPCGDMTVTNDTCYIEPDVDDNKTILSSLRRSNNMLRRASGVVSPDLPSASGAGSTQHTHHQSNIFHSATDHPQSSNLEVEMLSQLSAGETQFETGGDMLFHDTDSDFPPRRLSGAHIRVVTGDDQFIDPHFSSPSTPDSNELHPFTSQVSFTYLPVPLYPSSGCNESSPPSNPLVQQQDQVPVGSENESVGTAIMHSPRELASPLMSTRPGQARYASNPSTPSHSHPHSHGVAFQCRHHSPSFRTRKSLAAAAVSTKEGSSPKRRDEYTWHYVSQEGCDQLRYRHYHSTQLSTNAFVQTPHDSSSQVDRVVPVSTHSDISHAAQDEPQLTEVSPASPPPPPPPPTSPPASTECLSPTNITITIQAASSDSPRMENTGVGSIPTSFPPQQTVDAISQSKGDLV